MKITNKHSEAVGRIMERCFGDEEFRRMFKADPKAVLEKMAGTKIREDVQVKTVESTPEQWVFVVPSEEVRTAMNAARGVDDRNMGAVTGGTTNDGSLYDVLTNSYWLEALSAWER